MNKIKLNKQVIARLTNPEMKNILGGEAPNCWGSQITCTTTGARTTCKSKSCTSAGTGFTCNLSCIPLGNQD